MKILRLVCIVAFIFIACSAFAQGVYLEKGQNGFGGEVRAIWSIDAFQGVGFVTGYSIAGILDIGGSLQYTLGELAGFSSSDLRIAFDYRVNVLKQSIGVPLSLQIMGSYGLNDVSSEYLDNDNAISRGTGYTIGLTLSRNFRLSRFLLLRLNLITDYESITYSTFGDTLDEQEHVGNLFYGGGLGFLLVFPKGQTLSVQGELRADQDLELHIHPVFAVAFPQK